MFNISDEEPTKLTLLFQWATGLPGMPISDINRRVVFRPKVDAMEEAGMHINANTCAYQIGLPCPTDEEELKRDFDFIVSAGHLCIKPELKMCCILTFLSLYGDGCILCIVLLAYIHCIVNTCVCVVYMNNY